MVCGYCGEKKHKISTCPYDNDLVKLLYSSDPIDFNLLSNKVLRKIASNTCYKSSLPKTELVTIFTRIKSKHVKADTVEEDCAICYEKLETTNVCTTSCGHKFCMTCILQMVHNNSSSSNSCPLCRKALIEEPLYNRRSYTSVSSLIYNEYDNVYNNEYDNVYSPSNDHSDFQYFINSVEDNIPHMPISADERGINESLVLNLPEPISIVENEENTISYNNIIVNNNNNIETDMDVENDIIETLSSMATRINIRRSNNNTEEYETRQEYQNEINNMYSTPPDARA